MTMGYATTLRNTRLNDIRDAIDAGAAAGTVKIYTGTRPATGAALSGNTLLSTGTFSDPSAPSAASGVLTFSSITYTDAVADGTATWARIEDSDGTFVADASVGTTGSGEDITLNAVTFVTGGPVNHVSATITAGNA